jgi:hypothetical protein
MKTGTLYFKNAQTGEAERIRQEDIRQEGWGFEFFVDSEPEAYRAAYLYRNNPHGCKVDYAGGIGKWVVIVFNADAAFMGIDGAK